jgi:shikimate dehydrogenase
MFCFMKLFGLIGYPLHHSFSAKYFAEKFRNEKIPGCEYRNFPLPGISDLPELINAHTSLCGLNVTIPHKKNVIPFLNLLDDTAQKVGAVNTIRVNRQEGSIFLEGFNTDVNGFAASLTPLLTPRMNTALVLGSGGASLAVRYVLDTLGIRYTLVGREAENGKIGYSRLNDDLIAENLLIINTTPLGTAPQTDEIPPIPFTAVGPDHLLFDLIYNPPVTRFLSEGVKKGAKTKNGYEMLVLQAEKAWEIWNS